MGVVRTFTALALASAAAALGMCCNKSSPPSTVGEIPPKPDAAPTTNATTTTFAIDAIFLGDVDPLTDTPSTAAWRSLGFNLDGLITSETSTDVCMLQSDAGLANQADGVNGIDNAFGASLVPILQTALLMQSLSDDQTKQIRAGAWTVELTVTGLSSDPLQSAVGLGTQAFIGEMLDAAPSFDTPTNWPVLPSSLADGVSIDGGARTKFSNVYVTHGTLVAEGALQPLMIPLQFHLLGGFGPDAAPPTIFFLPLRIHGATIVFEQAASRGIIGGVLDPSEVIGAFLAFARSVSPSLCGSATDGIVHQLMQLNDILPDGTNTAGKPCNGISIGLGFTAKRIANPAQLGVDRNPLPDQCDAAMDAPDDALDAGIADASDAD